MRIAFDLNPVLINIHSGFYSFGKGLLCGLNSLAEKPQFSLFYSKRYDEEAQNIKRELAEWAQLKPTIIKMRWLENFWRYCNYPKLELFTGKFDIYHCFDHMMPPTKGKPRIMTIHDLRRYTLPELYTTSKLYRFELAVKRADHFIAVSQSAKEDLCNIFNIQEDKVSVVYLAADEKLKPITLEEKQLNKVRLSKKTKTSLDKYIIAFSSPDARKNIWRIIRAFKMAKKQLPDNLKLVVIGNLPKNDEELISRATVKSLEKDGVFLTGAVNDIRDWLSCADGLVYTTLYEGFGIPILEAFACGAPVITSNLSSMPEVAGPAALLVDPYSEEAISQEIIRLYNDDNLRENLIQAGFHRNNEFSWSRTASKTLEVYEKLL